MNREQQLRYMLIFVWMNMKKTRKHTRTIILVCVSSVAKSPRGGGQNRAATAATAASGARILSKQTGSQNCECSGGGEHSK